MALAAFLESCLARQTFQGEIRGGIMLARGSEKSTLAMRQLWLRISRLLAAGHDLSLDLLQHFIESRDHFLPEDSLKLSCVGLPKGDFQGG
eukprot:g12864.t1